MNPFFSVVVPTIDRESLKTVLDALRRQTIDRSAFEIIVVSDGIKLGASSLEAAERLGATVIESPIRKGPGAARNIGASFAIGEWIVFTEDDVQPDDHWLSAASDEIRKTDIDVLEGSTLLPDGTSARRRTNKQPTFIPTNLFVRATTFRELGGYCEWFFNARSKTYFREDSDLGFSLEAAKARIAVSEVPVVTHPFEHPSALDPLRWAKRYEMDPVLRFRHPARFRRSIEVSHVGPFRVCRPFVRACQAFVFLSLLLPLLAISGMGNMTKVTASLIVASGLFVWAKWSFDLKRLAIVPLVPFVLVASLGRGQLRVRQLDLNS